MAELGSMDDERKSWVAEKFAQFLVELERQRIAVQRGEARLYGHDRNPEDTRMAGPNSAWNALESLLQAQKDEAASRGGNVHKKYQDAQLAMAAFADEVFTDHLRWDGAEAWKQSSLQHHFFTLTNAGQIVFQQIQTLVAPGQRVDKDLVRIYHDIIVLGFKGQYAVLSGGDGKLAEIRSQLFDTLHDHDTRPSHQVSPQAYDNVLREGASIPLPDTRQAFVFLGIVIALFLVTSGISGCLLKSEIRDHLDRVDSALGSESSRGQGG